MSSFKFRVHFLHQECCNKLTLGLGHLEDHSHYYVFVIVIFFCHHNFMKKGHFKLSKNEPENNA